MTEPREEMNSEETPDSEAMTADDGGEAAAEAAAETAAAEEVREPEPEPTPEELLTAERDEFREKWLRAMAELDNQRKRSRRELSESRRFAQADTLRALLPVADNFERALAHMNDDAGEGGSVREGIELIHQSFRSALRERGVVPIEALGAEFDPNLHEAVGQLEREGAEAGTVIEIAQPGYTFGDMVLRPARVIVAL